MRWFKKLFGIHKHNYKTPVTIQGVDFLRCDYPGCTCLDLSPEQEARDRRRHDEIMSKLKELQNKYNKILNHEVVHAE